MKFRRSTVSFGRHETFPLRFGWIAKGFHELKRNAEVFSNKDATVTLGVGQNMVSSIRFYLLASQIVERKQKSSLAPTEIGNLLFGETGDPYLEDATTLWLLHWLLATNPTEATSIYWFFNHFHKVEFTSAELSTALIDFTHHHVAAPPSNTTLERDATLLLRMWGHSSKGEVDSEAAADSPLSLLDLQERIDSRTWRILPRRRRDMPLPAFAFAVAELFERLEVAQLGLHQLMYSDMRHCAPGSVFRLSEEGLVDKLQSLCEQYPRALQLDSTAGLTQLYLLDEFDSRSILRIYYPRATGRTNRFRKELVA